MQVNGKTSDNQDNINLKGYLVNDSNSIKKIDDQEIKKYIEQDKNNVFIVETKDYPIHYTTAFFIGIAQMFAILPGISRSGITITLAILIGISGTTAFRFSFLLAIPIITGAGILSFIDILFDILI